MLMQLHQSNFRGNLLKLIQNCTFKIRSGNALSSLSLLPRNWSNTDSILKSNIGSESQTVQCIQILKFSVILKPPKRNQNLEDWPNRNVLRFSH